MHPAAWILWATCAGLVAFSTTNPLYLLPLIAVAWFVNAVHRRPGPTARSFRTFLLFGLVVEHRGAGLDRTLASRGPGDEQESLGETGFSAPAMSD